MGGKKEEGVEEKGRRRTAEGRGRTEKGRRKGEVTGSEAEEKEEEVVLLFQTSLIYNSYG